MNRRSEKGPHFGRHARKRSRKQRLGRARARHGCDREVHSIVVDDIEQAKIESGELMRAAETISSIGVLR